MWQALQAGLACLYRHSSETKHLRMMCQDVFIPPLSCQNNTIAKHIYDIMKDFVHLTVPSSPNFPVVSIKDPVIVGIEQRNPTSSLRKYGAHAFLFGDP